MARKKTENGIFSKINFTESYTSLIVGAIVILVIGILFVIIAKGNKTMQTSSTNESSSTENQITQDKSNTSSTYTIKPGDDLWSISENVYNDGYKWLEIAKMNKLENPGLIHIGNKLTIPEVEKEKVIMQEDKSIQESGKTVVTNAINGTTYTIKAGDNLWDISVRAYGDGYKWLELAKVNNIPNPDLIYPNNVLKIPR